MARNSKHSKLHKFLKHYFLKFLVFGLKLSLVFIVIVLGFALYLNSEVQEKFTGKKWTIPAKVYARPLELFVGQKLSLSDLILELEALGYRKQDAADIGNFNVTGNSLTLYSRGFKFYDGLEPARKVTVTFNKDHITKLAQNDDEPLPLMRLEPLFIGGIYPAHNEDRLLINLNEVPYTLIQTLVAVEDRSFYSHFGISFRSIARAIWINLRYGKLSQGGSTLTQQLAKNFFLTNERTIKRKAVEAIMALIMEVHYSKNEILETYLNEVFLGQDGSRAVHGFGLASQYYFATPIAELKLHQIALLVGMVKGPTYYNPRKNPKTALERRNVVIDVLLQQEVIDEQTANNAKKQPLDVTERGALTQTEYPAFLDMVKRKLREDYQEQDLTEEGLMIFTSFNPILQHKAEQALLETIKSLSARKAVKGIEGAMIVTNPENGEILALIGGKDSRFAGFNRVLDAKRPIGSLVKPAVYLTALANPDKYHLTSMLLDEEIKIKSRDGKIWSPQNYDRKEHGQVLLYQALGKSYNLATIKLGMGIGIPTILQTINNLGVSVDWPKYPAILLGSGAMTPLQVATMYQTIAAGGFNLPFKPIRNVLNMQNEPLKSYPFVIEQKIDSAYIYLLQEALQYVMRKGTGSSSYSRIDQNINLAGKTGTTNDYRDSWFAGFGQDLLAVVWLGHDDNRTTGLSGATGALQVWSKFMQQAKVASLKPVAPDNIINVTVDPITGLSLSDNCANAIIMPYIRGSEPDLGNDCVDGNLQLNPDSNSFMDWLQNLGN